MPFGEISKPTGCRGGARAPIHQAVLTEITVHVTQFAVSHVVHDGEPVMAMAQDDGAGPGCHDGRTTHAIRCMLAGFTVTAGRRSVRI
jgi:hypothetical protein